MTISNMVKTDLLILGAIPVVINEHMKPFLGIFSPFLSHMPNIENNLPYHHINALFNLQKKIHLFVLWSFLHLFFSPLIYC